MTVSTDASKTGIPNSSLNNLVHQKILLVNINAAATDVAQIINLPAKYRITKFQPYDASKTLAASLATLGLFTAAAGGGTALVAPATLTTLTTPQQFIDMTLAVPTTYRTETTLFIRNVVADGTAGTISVLFEYIDLT